MQPFDLTGYDLETRPSGLVVARRAAEPEDALDRAAAAYVETHYGPALVKAEADHEDLVTLFELARMVGLEERVRRYSNKLADQDAAAAALGHYLGDLSAKGGLRQTMDCVPGTGCPLAVLLGTMRTRWRCGLLTLSRETARAFGLSYDYERWRIEAGLGPATELGLIFHPEYQEFHKRWEEGPPVNRRAREKAALEAARQVDLADPNSTGMAGLELLA